MAIRSRPKPLGHWFKQSPTIKELLAGCQQHSDLLDLVRSRLPDPLCDHCCGASLEGTELHLAVDSPAWSGRLRFMQGRLMQELAAVGIRVERLKVATSPRPGQPKPHARPPQHLLSQANAELIKSLAEGISNPVLKGALGRLAKRHE